MSSTVQLVVSSRGIPAWESGRRLASKNLVLCTHVMSRYVKELKFLETAQQASGPGAAFGRYHQLMHQGAIRSLHSPSIVMRTMTSCECGLIFGHLTCV